MEDSAMNDSVFGNSDADSDVFVPPTKARAKPAPKNDRTTKAATMKATKEPKVKMPPKKLTQSTLKMAKTTAKKRPKPESDDQDEPSEIDEFSDGSMLSHTPPSAKKQRKASVKKATASKPLRDIENESMHMDGPADKPSKKKTATDQYQKLTQLEHIIKRPDTYIGSVERTEEQMWVYNSETSEMELRKIQFVPGLYKIFDEILVNAADNKQRDKSMKTIRVVVNRDTGEISVENDGAGIPVQIHQKEGIYIPEMIFGHLLTGSNYDDDEQKTTGGRNGYGAKLCNIFSTAFTLETQDSDSGKRYKQTWTDNMSTMAKAKISASKSADFTRITFTPDYNKFKMSGIDEDFEALVKRRIYDMAGTVQGVKVFLNGTQIKLDFKKYIEMYAKAIKKERGAEDGSEPASASVIVEDLKAHEKWQIGFAVSDGSFQQVSFVNSIATTSGGTHVNYIADQIVEKLTDVVKKKNAKGATLKSNQIKNHIFLFVNSLITNPAFTSQTKEQLTTKPKQFGSKCVLTDKFLKAIGQTDAVQNILNFAQAKADQVLAKSDGNKRSRMSNPKLVDANLAGTKRGHECTLILTEGDSAKGLAVAGRAILDPDRIGVFPLRGKLLNVRDASIDQISKNAEIQNIKQFLGLKHKQSYENSMGLRYGHLMIMADQDHDGSHIKGLLINFLQVQFPSLLKMPNFFREFITPIVKVWKGPNPKKPLSTKSFFTMPQYEEWKEQHAHERGWSHKYFKGLGTSTPQDAQVYFGNLDVHLREFETMKQEEEEMIDLAFSKKKADQRKTWLGNFVPGTFLDHSTSTITYNNFVNKELILFSMADNLRSIPSVIDGLKPGQRKVMYGAFKRNLKKDTKVIELAGYVMENTAYHHGETSMQQTIIGLAQTYVGSNNINCLEPSGNFGTRLAGGSDAASPRYIFTRLSPFARRVFSALDEPNLEYNTDDGRQIEPMVYSPVVPMVLINGADGIGTGWSTSIPNYHPLHVVENLKRRMGRLESQNGFEEPFVSMTPWFRGWKGTSEEAGPNRFNFNGFIREAGENEVEITELPIRVWTDDFKARLEDIIKAEKVPSFIKDYKEFNDHKTVHFIIQLDEKHMKAALNEGLAEKFKLNKTVATSNLVAFDLQGRIRKYEKVEDIMEEFYGYRMMMYTKRKEHWLAKIHTDYRKLKNQARFVMEIIENKLVVSKKKKPVLVAELRQAKYEAFPKIAEAKRAGETEDVVENDDEIAADEDSGARDFDYLLGLPIWSLTQERVDKLKQQMHAKKEEHDALQLLSEKDLWCQDLDEFVLEWDTQIKEDDDLEKDIRSRGRRASRKIGAGKTTKGRVKKEDDDFNPTKSKAIKATKSTKSGLAQALAPNPNKGIVKVEPKPHPNFSALLKPNGVKVKPTKPYGSDGAEEASGLSDDDFAELAITEPSKQISRAPSEQPVRTNGRAKRTAAAAPKKWVEEDDSESDDGNFLGDVGDMVKGIGGGDAANGRLSLFAMSASRPAGDRPPSSAGLPKIKSKASRVFDDEAGDETNYELLAKSSPHKPPPARETNLDSFLSDDDLVPVTKKVPAPATAKRGAKPKAVALVEMLKPAEPKVLSPAAKAYAAKQSKLNLKKDAFSADEESDIEMNDSPPPKVTKKAPLRDNVISDDDESDIEMNDSPPPKPVAIAKARSAAKQPVISDDEDMSDAPKPAVKSKASGKKVPAKNVKKVVSDDENDEVDRAPKRVRHGRPARAAVTKAKHVPVYVDSDSDESLDEDDFDASAVVEDEPSEDDFDDSE
ncbi:DNA topoisomerase [Calycina marina]|uniref:DNA topoisomerase 2 n=1 Tax=Calycina marina TaxID=1763456 RepID=A0A9P8CJR5_9HELO|nr:DNA topoisomerase [Calycina marina]